MDYRTPLSRVRGLGSAKEGTGHWISQRVTGIALVPLVLWFIFALIGHLGASHAEVVAWLSNPVSATLMTLGIGAGFAHARIGLQEVIADYVHGEGAKVAALLMVNFACWGFAIAAIFSIWKIAFTA